METYHIPEPANTSITTSAGQKVMRFLTVAGGNFIAYFALFRLWNFFSPFSKHEPLFGSTNGTLAMALIFGILMGLMSPWSDRRLVRRLRKASYPYEIVVSDEEMIGISPKYRRRIRKGHVRTIYERTGGILASERGPVGRFFLGGIWIPKTLPEYEHLRAIVESWRIAP